MDQREQDRHTFLRAHGWDGGPEAALQSDASFRRYFRVTIGGEPRLVMDAPPGQEDVGPFVTIAEHLLSLGLSAPWIYAADRDRGFVLLEDFGDDTYTRLLGGGAAEEPLYALAIDALIALHRHPQAKALHLPAYDRPALLEKAGLFAEWYVPALGSVAEPDDFRSRFLAAWNAVFDALPPAPTTLVLRDYHVDNLMLLRGREGAAACGLLDFQDAAIGAMPYDVVSLLEDARRDIADDLAAAMLERYHQAMPKLDREVFSRWYAVLGAQRHCRIAGVFVRLWARDGKDVYLGHIPRVVRLLARALEHPAMAPVRDVVAPVVAAGTPDFTAAARDRVRALRGLT
jgi:aminoglycoside/choline kinase family phosphotransferase